MRWKCIEYWELHGWKISNWSMWEIVYTFCALMICIQVRYSHTERENTHLQFGGSENMLIFISYALYEIKQCTSNKRKLLLKATSMWSAVSYCFIMCAMRTIFDKCIRFELFGFGNLFQLFNEKVTSKARQRVTFNDNHRTPFISWQVPDSLPRLSLSLPLFYSRSTLPILFGFSGSEFSNGIENEWKYPDWVTLVMNVYVCTWKLCVTNFPPFFFKLPEIVIIVTWEMFTAFNLRMCLWQCHASFFSALPSIPSFIILDAEKCGTQAHTHIYTLCLCSMQKLDTKKKTITFVLFIYGILRQPLSKGFPCLHCFEWNHWIKLCVNRRVMKKVEWE